MKYYDFDIETHADSGARSCIRFFFDDGGVSVSVFTEDADDDTGSTLTEHTMTDIEMTKLSCMLRARKTRDLPTVAATKPGGCN